jgi:hypothetical protein
MGVAAHAERAEIDLVGMLLRISDQLPEILHRNVLVEDQHLVRERKVGDRLEVLERIIGQIAVEVRIERHRAARKQADRRPVGRRRLAGIGGDDGVGAGAALHDEAMPVALLEGLAERAHHDVDGPARRQRDDDADGSGGVAGLRDAGAAEDAQDARDCGQGEKRSNLHRLNPPTHRLFLPLILRVGGRGRQAR